MTDQEAGPLDAVRVVPPSPAPADPRLDQAEAVLAGLTVEMEGAPGDEQVAELEQVHALLAAALASVPRG